ncbi:MAG: Xaa-Pro peptidase family protein [Fimbriimonadales bacterium]|nr:Xaa-Pro peptidase family protein [Fimbriimonadales bacterium]
MPLHLERVERCRAFIRQAGWDCYLACTPVSMGYLTDFFEGGGERMLLMAFRGEGEPFIAMVAPALSRAHAEKTGIEDIRVWRDGEDPVEVFLSLARDWGLKAGIIGVDDEMPAGWLLPLQRALPAALFKPAGSVMGELRKRKDEEELKWMEMSARIADQAGEVLFRVLQAGATEEEVASALWSEMLRRGGKPTFCIVATGANGAEPHHETGDTVIKAGDVVIVDWGCLYKNYHSDITRTFAVGYASSKAKEVYRAVYQAHRAGRRAIRPGVPCEEIDFAARRVIEEAGLGEFFIHRTGHGIGLMGHEPPHIVKGSTSLLEEGQCFTVEPGVYLPGEFGVRLENVVVVTAEGHRSLNEEPPAELPVIG